MFKKLIKWVDEKLHGKDRRIAELEKKVKILEGFVFANPHIVRHVDDVIRVMNNNTQTLHYVLSKYNNVEIERDYLPGALTELYRIVSKD